MINEEELEYPLVYLHKSLCFNMFYIFESWLYQFYPEALEYPEETSIPINMEDPSTHPE